MSEYPAFPAFAVAVVALFAKVTMTSVVQVVCRFQSRAFLLPEDAALAGVRPQAAEAPFVQRCASVWRNDTENLPLFLLLALTYTLLGASLASAQWLFTSYVVLRYFHTIAYLGGRQPWRAMLYIAGMLVCWVIAVQLVVRIVLTLTPST